MQYHSSGKGYFPYESVTGFNSLSVTPDDGDFRIIEKFYSRLKDEGISQKERESCRKLYKILRMRNLSDFNDVYNIQDVYILSVILEYRWQKIKEATGFDPRCFTTASTLSGAIERIKSKVILTFPTNVETVCLMESLLSGGYSSVHSRLGFDTEIFTPRSPEYVEQKEDIINNLRDLYGEKNKKQERKKLMDKLYSLWKEEDLKSCHKPIYNVRLDGEETSKKRRVFSKVFKLDENNQYGFAMTKPLPIGIFKKQSDPNMKTLQNSLKNFDPNAKIREVFVVDIQFDAYDDVPRKRIYNEIYPCIFQSKSKVLPNRRSVCQLLSNVRSGKRGNIFSFKATEKTHATLDPKKRFPMFVGHIHFSTERAGWKVTKVHAHYGFEQELFKKEYILGNQHARQEAVARGDDLQANFWKLLSNSNFGFDSSDNSQNKSLHLIYDEDAVIEFLTKYEGCKSTNPFLSLEARIRNIEEKYKDVENLPFDEQPFAETLKKEEIKKVTEECNKKRVVRVKIIRY